MSNPTVKATRGSKRFRNEDTNQYIHRRHLELLEESKALVPGLRKRSCGKVQYTAKPMRDGGVR